MPLPQLLYSENLPHPTLEADCLTKKVLVRSDPSLLLQNHTVIATTLLEVIYAHGKDHTSSRRVEASEPSCPFPEMTTETQLLVSLVGIV